MKVEYHPALVTELEEIRDYYEQQSAGLGYRFVEEFEQQIQQMAGMPERWMILRGDIRRALMKRYPYVIYFRITLMNNIRVTVVKHEKRHPAYGLGRR